MNLVSQINIILKRFEEGDKLKSYKELQKIFNKNKDNNLLRYNLAVIQQNLNFNKEARINYNHLIKVEKNLKAMINLYNMDITEANYYEAFNTIESILKIKTIENVVKDKAFVLYKLNRIEEAKKICIFYLKKNNKDLVYISDQKYSNTGFALIYDDELKKEKKISKKIDNRSLLIFHNKIKKNSFVKITNPVNDKSIIAEVISNNVKFSSFYNSVITQRIAEELSLDPKEPYIDLVLISKSSTFVAKKAKTFDEEKNVAEKAPVDGIIIDNLGNEKDKEVKIKKNKFLYSIKIADFYYRDSAENMVNRIKDETNIKKSVIKKLSKTKYRVLLGPFNDIKKLEKSFNEIKVLNFENIEILKDV